MSSFKGQSFWIREGSFKGILQPQAHSVVPGFGRYIMYRGRGAIQSITEILAAAEILPPLFFSLFSLLFAGVFRNELQILSLCLSDIDTKDQGIFYCNHETVKEI